MFFIDRVLYSYLVAFNGAVSSQKLNKPPFGPTEHVCNCPAVAANGLTSLETLLGNALICGRSDFRTAHPVKIHQIPRPTDVYSILSFPMKQRAVWEGKFRHTQIPKENPRYIMYRRGRPRSRFMPPPADKQIAQNPHHS